MSPGVYTTEMHCDEIAIANLQILRGVHLLHGTVPSVCLQWRLVPCWDLLLPEQGPPTGVLRSECLLP